MIVGGRFAAPRPPEGIVGPAGEIPWLGASLAARQAAAFAEAGLPLVAGPIGPSLGAVLVREDAAVTADALKALADAGRAAGQDRRFSLGGRSGALATLLALGRDEPLAVYLHGDGPWDLERIRAAPAVEIDPKERLFPPPEPVMDTLAVTDRLVLPMGHWAQALWANLLGLGPFLWRGLLGRHPAVALGRIAWAALRAGSLNPARIAGKVVRRGRGCRVHPAAVVEACWLGDNVQVGAGAVVRGAVLGDGAVVEEQALVAFSTLSPGARVQRQALVKYSLLAEGAVVAGTMQLGVIDRGSVVKYGAILMDLAMGRPVTVLVGDARLPAPLGMLGVCVGARTTVATGVYVAPGRALPPDLQILPDPDAVLRRVEVGLTGAVVVRGGRMERA